MRSRRWSRTRVGRPFSRLGARAVYAAPRPALRVPGDCRASSRRRRRRSCRSRALFVVLAVIAWRALATSEAGLYFVAAFFAVAAEASWSATHLVAERLGAAVAPLCGVRALLPRRAARRGGAAAGRCSRAGAAGRCSSRAWCCCCSWPAAARGGGALGPRAAAGDRQRGSVHRERRRRACRCSRSSARVLSWIVLGVWWDNAAAAVGVLPSLLVLVGLTLDHARRSRLGARDSTRAGAPIAHAALRLPPRRLSRRWSASSSSSSLRGTRNGRRRRGRCSARSP